MPFALYLKYQHIGKRSGGFYSLFFLAPYLFFVGKPVIKVLSG